MTRFRASVWAGVLLAALAGCAAPQYVKFISPYRDFTCDVPWGWQVYLDGAGSDYTNVTFAGPLEPEFLRGTPSLTVRWYAYGASHHLTDGTVERYASVDDFKLQMLRDVYGPQAYTKAGSDYDQELAASRDAGTPDFTRVKVSEQEATYYVVYRNMPAPKGITYGVVKNAKGEGLVRQRHAYVVLPMRSGFYVILYPATRDGFEKYKEAYFHLVHTFRALKDGPAGAVFAVKAQR